MDRLTKELQSLLVRLHYEPQKVSDHTAHQLEHLFRLLNVDDEDAVLRYFGILGREQVALSDIAQEKGLESEEVMEAIDTCLRKLAVTPEWQIIKQQDKHTER